MFDDKTFDELNVIAMKLVSDNRWDDTAIEVNKRLITKESKNHAAYTRLAKCLLAKGDRQGAYKIYKEVLEFDPSNTISYNFVKAVEFSQRKAKQEKAKDDKIAKDLEDKLKKKEEIKRMISDICS